ncbi:MAG: hypothetical protein IPN94_09190 [Sphingobacteriales bacterium]|nr:hypothetical protein [Sphingobacteriales bacterium]
MLIIDDEREGKHTLFNFSLLNDEICEDNFPSNVAVELAPVEKQICSPWVNKAGEFFKKNTFCESFNGKWKNNTFSFPDCGTMEGLFEKYQGYFPRPQL